MNKPNHINESVLRKVDDFTKLFFASNRCFSNSWTPETELYFPLFNYLLEGFPLPLAFSSVKKSTWQHGEELPEVYSI
jgi:hypothetical protein